MKIQMQIVVKGRYVNEGVKIEAPVEVLNSMQPHDMTALLFACEFAINNHASAILGKPIRAHIFVDDTE